MAFAYFFDFIGVLLGLIVGFLGVVLLFTGANIPIIIRGKRTGLIMIGAVTLLMLVLVYDESQKDLFTAHICEQISFVRGSMCISHHPISALILCSSVALLMVAYFVNGIRAKLRKKEELDFPYSNTPDDSDEDHNAHVSR